MKTLLCLVVFILSASLAGATDGNYLYHVCKDYGSGQFNSHNAMCRTYIMGFIDGAATDRLAAKEGAERFCIQSDLTYNQLISVVTKYLGKNPGLYGVPKGSIVNDALAAAFPCISDASVQKPE